MALILMVVPLGPLAAQGVGAADKAPKQMPVQLSDLGPLARPAPVAPATPAPKRKLSFQNSLYQAAPVPDPDAGAPASHEAPEASVGPRLITPRNLFLGDGYAYASGEVTDVRKKPAAGLGLTVPLENEP